MERGETMSKPERAHNEPLDEERSYDVAGVGIGPFNLSVAALLAPIEGMKNIFFERRKSFSWHPGLLLPEGDVQVSFIKDLVTLADPTSPYSFLSFLHRQRRMYRFINAAFPKIKRLEFNQYFQWVCQQLPNLYFGRAVESITLDGGELRLDLGDCRIGARNVVLGSGLTPNVPDCCRSHLGATVFHSGTFLHHDLDLEGKRVVVVGGGQSGAEVVNHLISAAPTQPAHLTWVARRSNFLPLDATPFVEELFTPAHADFFFQLPAATRQRLLAEQRFASDGINANLLAQIYRRLYELEFLHGAGRPFSLHIATALFDLRPSGSGWELGLENRVSGELLSIEADVVILATGFGFAVPSCMAPLMSRIDLEAGRFFPLREDYSLVWDGPEGVRIYAQNAARHCRGVADPNLSLMAWRSATIVNSLLGRTAYDVGEASSAFDWGRAEARDRVLWEA